MLNNGIVVWSDGASSFEMWASLGITDKRMNNQDQILLSKTGTYVDGYSTSQSNSAVKKDADISCTNNDVLISSGKNVATGNTYIYWHGKRNFNTGDSSCDTTISSSTQLCLVYK